MSPFLKGSGKVNKKKKNFAKIMLLLGSFILAGSLIVTSVKKNNIEKISYPEYQELLNNNEVDIVYYSEDEEYMTIILSNEETKNMSVAQKEKYNYKTSEFRKVFYPAGEDFKKELLEQGVIVKTQKGGVINFLEKNSEFFFYILFLGGIFFIMKKASPMSNTGFAQKANAEEIEVSFSDVIGHEEIKGDLQLLVKQIKNGAKATELSHGVLFEGSAGTGKTMLAKAIAHEAGVNFISVNSSNLIEVYVGVGAKRVRSAFKEARENAPCVLFFDEIDAVGAKRGSQKSNRENDQTINALLTELDGFADKGDILVIAATNRADNLDEALLRSGRFDRQIKVEIPKKWETRQELFEHYLKGKKDETVNTEVLAKQTSGFSGADIAAICREARLIAFREDKKLLTHNFLEESIDKMVFKGNRSNSEQNKEDLECVAFHEAGHAIMSLLMKCEISRISIMGMTSGVGGAVFYTDNDSVFLTKEQIEAKIMITYAGRASEQIKYGEDKITQGASNDITQATKLLSTYITKYGFDKQTGLVDYEVLSENTLLQNDTIAKRISELSNQFYEKTIQALEQNYDKVEKLVTKLLEAKTMSGEEVEKLLVA